VTDVAPEQETLEDVLDQESENGEPSSQEDIDELLDWGEAATEEEPEAAAGDADEALAEELVEDVSGEELLESALNGETDKPEPEPEAPEVDEQVEPDVAEEDAVEAEPEQPEAEEKKDEKPAEPAGDGGASISQDEIDKLFG
jgi:hypothetical protein